MVDTVQNQMAYATPPETRFEDNPAKSDEFKFFGEDGFSFLDFVDVINPLQHIPVVSTAYRSITGDEIDPGSRLAGGTLFGGPIGLAASAFNVVLEHNTGKDTGEHVLAWFEGEEQTPESTPKYADADSAFGAPARNMASFAPFPASEAQALAAGEASLKLAEVQSFIAPDVVQIPTHTPQARGAGSLGAWAPPQNPAHPFPTERSFDQSDALTAVESPQAQALQAAAAPAPTQQVQHPAFQARQSHGDSIAALRAFAQDMKAQQTPPQGQPASLNAQSQETLRLEQAARAAQNAAPAPHPLNTAQLSQTDSSWFATMMSQNMSRFDETGRTEK